MDTYQGPQAIVTAKKYSHGKFIEVVAAGYGQKQCENGRPQVMHGS